LNLDFVFAKKLFHPELKIHEKSGNITKIVGQSVSLVTISSICLVHHSIKKSGKGKTLFKFILKISGNPHQFFETFVFNVIQKSLFDQFEFHKFIKGEFNLLKELYELF